MEIKLNLASKPYLNRQSIRLWLLFVSAVLVLLLLFNAMYSYQNYKQSQLLDLRMKELTGQIPGVSGVPAGYTPERYAAVQDEVTFINATVAADQFHWTHLLDRFEELLPTGVKITSIHPDFNQKSVQLTCAARDVTAMTEFVDNLLASEDLNQAFLKSHGEVESQKNGVTKRQVDFSLTIKEAF